MSKVNSIKSTSLDNPEEKSTSPNVKNIKKTTWTKVNNVINNSLVVINNSLVVIQIAKINKNISKWLKLEKSDPKRATKLYEKTFNLNKESLLNEDLDLDPKCQEVIFYEYLMSLGSISKNFKDLVKILSKYNKHLKYKNK